MKSLLALGSAFALMLVTGVAGAAKTNYTAVLTGAQEVPANASAATGTATLEFNDNNNMLTGTVTFAGMTPTAGHIHAGACGVSGGPILPAFTAPGTSPIQVQKTLSAGEATMLVAGGLYVNLHSATFTGGEIRGQLFLDGDAGVGCPAPKADAGTDSGTSGGTSGTSGTSGSNGATTTPADDAGTPADTGGGDSGGCSTAPSEGSSSGLAAAALAGFAVALVIRNRKKR